MDIIKTINNIKTKKDLISLKNKINEAIDARESFIELCEFAHKSGNNNFGFIKESFEILSPELFRSNEGKNIISKYIKTINESKNLKSLHTIFENIRKADKNVDIDFFINNITDTKWEKNNSTLHEDINKLGRVLSEAILCVGKKSQNLLSENVDNRLNSAIIYIIENNKNKNNIVDYSNAVKIIKENISSKEGASTIFENKNFDSYVNEIVESFNLKYKDLSETEKNIVKEVSKSDNKEELFNKYKTECITDLQKAKSQYKGIDEASYNHLTNIIEKIEGKKFINENISIDVCGFINLSKLFKECE
jgi:hypothetical protein